MLSFYTTNQSNMVYLNKLFLNFFCVFIHCLTTELYAFVEVDRFISAS